jgi:tetratricopeptide (TPR) repeat protein
LCCYDAASLQEEIMEEKSLFFVIVLTLVVLAIFVWLGVKSYREIEHPTLPKEAKESEEVVSPKMVSPATVAPRPEATPKAAEPPDPIDLGRGCYKQGKYAEAVGAFKKFLAEHPDSASVKDQTAGAQAMLEVQTAMIAKKWDDALRACSEAEKHSISLPDARRRRAEIEDEKAYAENYERGMLAVARKDSETAVKCFKAAALVAARLGKITDAGQLAAEMQKGKTTQTSVASNLDWIVKIGADRNDPYAIYAAVSCCLSSEAYKSSEGELKAKLDTVTKTIAGNREKFPSPRSSETVTKDVVKMQSGTVEKGQIVQEDEKVIKLRQEKGGRMVVRVLAVRDVAEKTKEVITAEDTNNKKAEELLNQAVTEMETKRLFDALHTLGVLACEFPDVPLMKNTERQEQIITGASVGTALKGGVTLQKLIETCVERCLKLCPKCGGPGKLPCETCKGQGKTTVPCPVCNGTGKMMCMACQGQSKIPGTAPGTFMRCPACAGKGTFNCAECKGTKTVSQPCQTCNGAKSLFCDTCNGTGQRTGMNR